MSVSEVIVRGVAVVAFVAVMLAMGAAALFGLVAGAMYLFERPSCEATAEAMGRDWRWGIWTECLIEGDDGTWVPLEAWREVDEG